MTKEDFEQLTGKTEQLTEYYRSNVERKIIVTELEWLKDYPYKTSKFERVVLPDSLGITDRYFGGQVYKAAKLKEKPYYVLVNKDDISIGIFIKDEDVDKLTYQELQKLATKYKLACGPKAKKEEIVSQLLTK